ncbi:MAG TPA: hypothetical protein VFZ91_02085 [Allosphingosinicella sp.]
MRIIWLLATGAGAAAIGAAAPAQSAVASFGHHGPRPGMGAPGGTGPAFDRLRHFRPGMGTDRRHGRHHRRFGRGGGGFVFPFGGGIAGPFAAIGRYGAGFFSGGEVRLHGGRAYYDYDRAYPYEWPSAAAGGFDRAGGAAESRPTVRCRLEHEVRVCRGGR